jgi:hypothetical protein
VDGECQAKVEKIFLKPGEDPNPRCEKCEGMRHDQPVSGMTILWGLTKQGDVTMKGEHSTYLALLDFSFSDAPRFGFVKGDL